MGEIWLTSDLHLNHRRIIELSHRPWETVEEMNAGLIANWNSLVAANDDVYVVGDFAFWRGEAQSIQEMFDALRGRKHLVPGNHDDKNKKVQRLPWASKEQIATIRYLKEGKKHRIIACHYAIESWKNAHYGYLHVHGHSHGKLRRAVPHRYDIGVDVRNYRPVNVDEVIGWAAAEAFIPQDAHGENDEESA